MLNKAGFARVVLTVIAVVAGSTSSAQAQIESVSLWDAGSGGYATYRVPGIVATKRGVLLAYCGGRKQLDRGDWADTDILLRRSLDGGRTWEPSRKIAGNGAELTDNIVAIADQQNGDVHLVYQKNYTRVFEIDTHDDGKTFTPEREITPAFDELRKDYDWNVVTPGTGHGIQLQSGRLLVSAWMAKGKVHADGTREHTPSAVATVYSDNHGKTWHRGDVVARTSGPIENPNETAAAQLPSGAVMLNMRTTSTTHLRAITTSKDGISGWAPAHFDVQLFDPRCSGGLLMVPANGARPARLYFSNPDSRDRGYEEKGRWGNRENLTIKVSEDGGKHWIHERVIDPGIAGYSDLAWTKDSIIIVYEAGSVAPPQALPAHVAVTRVASSWLLSGAIPPVSK